ncbi:FtsK/SpoIIIE domain-containing protein, partial [Cellulomonas shaoxiangyii]|uniref:FtsK/SpoIIIE domain-containing protein n=1 Tax=Cellulomonas shaoxiangyii TaxID=2566013 RepID=UPI00113AF8F2
MGRRPRRWQPGDALHVGGSVLRLRATWSGPARRWPAAPSPWVWSALASTAGGVALAVALRQPLLLVGAAVGVVGLLAGGRQAPGPTRSTADDPADDDQGAPPPDVAAVRADTARWCRTGVRVPPCAPGAAWPADRALALVGERAQTLAVARGIVLRALAGAPGASLVVRSGAPADWAWARWLAPATALPAAVAPGGGPPAVVVADGADAVPGTWRGTASEPPPLLVVVVPSAARPPAWVRTVVHVGAGRAIRTEADGSRTTAPAEMVCVAVAEDAARRLAAVAWRTPSPASARGGASTGPSRPAAAVAWAAPAVLGTLPGVPSADPAAVARRWAGAGHAPLRAPLGAAADGTHVVLDLDADGPHVLVGGTTGAGKSELLTTLVLGLALQHPPHRLALLLADFKGGAGLGPLAGLPHVVDHVDDLDAGAARRTLTGLRAELRRREQVLAAAGVADLRRLDPDAAATPPRLVLVVDELRALVDDVPEAVEVLTRVAAQGRALGVHLLLATQRPAGVVTADLRANVTQRVALRVTDDADSRDVVDVPDAARLDPAHPGRAVVRVGSREPRTVQVARARHGGARPGVRLVAGGAGSGAHWRPPAAGRAEDHVAAWVSAARGAADGRPGPAVPWCPALPDRVAVADVPAGEGLALALADVPEEQRRAPVRWRPATGPLLVLGGPGSGRSTALLTVAAEATRGGSHVHALGLPEAALRQVTYPSHLGTVLSLDDAHRTGLLLHRLLTRAEGRRPDVLVVDRLDVLLETLGRHARGVAADMLATTWRDPVPGLALAASAAVVPAVTRLLGDVPTRLVLPVVDPSADALAGVPPGLAAARSTPGRGVVCGAGPARLCQVALPPAPGGDAEDRRLAGAPDAAGPAP